MLVELDKKIDESGSIKCEKDIRDMYQGAEITIALSNSKDFDFLLAKIITDNLNLEKTLEKVKQIYKIERDISPTFTAIVENLKSFFFILASLNNERIKRQQGEFILFGPLADKPITPNTSIIIPAKSKNIILKQLEAMGITEEYLFPDLDTQAKAIMNKFPKQFES